MMMIVCRETYYLCGCTYKQVSGAKASYGGPFLGRDLV